MDAVANPTVQLQDIPAGQATMNEDPNVLEKTISRLSGRATSQTRRSQHSTATPIRARSTSRRRDAREAIDEEIVDGGDTEDIFPEGGLRAWLAVVGATLMLLPSFGFMGTYGFDITYHLGL